ncbi:aldo/keto reductase [Kutzneria viridogrisea]|uniref:Aryl-alcohol dehydrogenase-like predicted oxidoreductase n=1 Tax=Kutzneria viridogrisea TaxID=47990 RepID=A0ABR6BAE4_9PSEU|nr:aryl-alcohol dehydrogenase-like predicted oxidoreductase [Kutzneria viridogrisea]
MTVPTRMLGGLASSAVGLGCLPLTGGYGQVAAEEAVAAIRTALDLGVRLVDTADFYGGGEVERIVGTAIRGRRAEATVATRGGAVTRGSARPTEYDGRPEFLRQACAASLRRLGTDYIDLYLLARPDPAVPIEDSVGGLGELVDAGMVRHIGLSEVSEDALRRAATVRPLAVVESEYSLWFRDVERRILPTLRELGVGLLAHSPLGRGFLTGGLTLGPTDYRRRQPRFSPENLAAEASPLAELTELADAHGVRPAQLALAWLLTRDEAVVPIPGTRDRGHLAENAVAARLDLPASTVARLTALWHTAQSEQDGNQGGHHPS